MPWHLCQSKLKGFTSYFLDWLWEASSTCTQPNTYYSILICIISVRKRTEKYWAEKCKSVPCNVKRVRVIYGIVLNAQSWPQAERMCFNSILEYSTDLPTNVCPSSTA